MGADARSGRLARLLREVETLRRLLRLYPHGHPGLAETRQRLRDAADSLVGDGALRLVIGPDGGWLDQERLPLAEGAPPLRLLRLLFQLGIAAVRIQPPAELGLLSLAERLAAIGEPPGEGDRQTVLAAELPGIELVPIDLSSLHLSDGQETPLWSEIAGRLARRGVLPRPLPTDAPEDGGLAGSLTGVELSDALLEEMFAELGALLGTVSPAHAATRRLETRAFLAELFTLLPAQRRALAVATAASHFPPAADDEDAPVIAVELLLEAAEWLLDRDLSVPVLIERAVHQLAAPQGSGVRNPRLIAWARTLLTRFQVLPASELPTPRAEPSSWEDAAWSRELAAALGEGDVRRHLVRALGETITLWPSEAVAGRAAQRLAEEFVLALEVADFEGATRLAAQVAASRDRQARRIAMEGGVPAAIHGLRTFDRSTHQTIAAILGSLGEPALPLLLEALADEESLVVRKRLLEVIARHGDRAIPHLRPLLDDPRWFVVRNAIFLLRRVGDREIASLIKTRLRGAGAQVLEEMLKTLVSLEDPDWLTLLTRELDRPPSERQAVVVAVASRVPHPAVVSALVDRLAARLGRGLREPLALELIRALGRQRDPAALQVLLEVTETRQWRLGFDPAPARREAAVAIAQLAGEDARQAALRLTEDRDRELAAAVRLALRHEQRSRPA